MSVLESDTIDLMVTDLRLGGEDGMKLIDRALRMPHPPICIMMTAYGSRGYRRRGDEARRLRFRHQADQHRQAGNPDPARPAGPRD